MKHAGSSHRVGATIALMLILTLAMGGASSALAKGKGSGNGRGNSVVTEGPMAAVQIQVISYRTSRPIEGARVRLYNVATGYSETARTGSDGIATFNNVPYIDTYYRAALVCHGFASSVRLITVDEPIEFFTQAML